MSLPDLAAVLWQQRDALERLTYRLECELLVIGQGNPRWLHRATTEVETLLDELAIFEVRRAQVSDAAAAEIGLPAGSTLEDLAAAASPPWSEVFSEHREALLVLTDGLAALAETNRSMLSAGLTAVQETLAVINNVDLVPATKGYDSRARRDDRVIGSLVIDRRL